VVRGADDVQVMQPDEVAAVRLPALTTLAPVTTELEAESEAESEAEAGATAATGDSAATSTGPSDDTVPVNQDTRPPELRLFDAFGKFRTCLDERGYGIEGDLTDPNNPAYQDSAYVDAVSTCAARTDIVNILQEVQATRSNLTPEEVEVRNVIFADLRTCLEARGWTIETTTSEIGLLEPAVFQNAEGVLDERDINQCLSEQNLGEN
jgi:hypothetical protein